MYYLYRGFVWRLTTSGGYSKTAHSPGQLLGHGGSGASRQCAGRSSRRDLLIQYLGLGLSLDWRSLDRRSLDRSSLDRSSLNWRSYGRWRWSWNFRYWSFSRRSFSSRGLSRLNFS